MSKRRRLLTEAAALELWNSGRGQRDGATYQPWLTIHDVASRGLVSRIQGWKHHLLSNGELSYFYQLEWSDSVIDIREQFPLWPIDETRQIAATLGIKHPKPPFGKDFITVMTSDFRITTADGRDVVRTVKKSGELRKRRTIEKSEVERCYWENHGIDWGIVIAEEIPKTFNALSGGVDMLKKTELMGPGLSKATNFLGPLGVFSNTMSTLGSVDDIYHHGANAENVVGLAGISTGLVSSGISTTELMLGASETLGPIGAVLGMCAGGVAAGQGAKNVAAENNYFGDNRSVSNWSADIADDIRESGHPILGGLSIPFTSLGGNAYTGARWAGGKIADGAGAVKDGASWLGGQAVDAGAAAWHAGGRAVDYAKDNMTLDPDEIDWGRTFNPFDW